MMSVQSLRKIVLVLLSVWAAVAFTPLMAQSQPPVLNANADGVFLDGYDVVAYFTTNEAQQGSTAYQAKYDGVMFHFSSIDNLRAFQAEPDRYLPKYGGFCAFAMANGKAGVTANPKTFKLYNGELLMFYDDLYEGKRFNTSVPWNTDETAHYAKAEQYSQPLHR